MRSGLGPIHSLKSLQPRAIENSATMLDIRGGTVNANAPNKSSILPYTHGLNGVNIPLDQLVSAVLWISMIAIACIILFARLAQLANSHLRHLYSLSATPRQQNYWSMHHGVFWPKIKKHLIYAPLGTKRHNREFRLSAAMNVGILPSRFHTLVLLLYVLSNVIYCLLLDYSEKNKAELMAELRGRSGTLAVVNMVPLILFAGRNNPLIALLKVSFDTYNLLHRWMGRIVIIESLVHTFAWLANSMAAKGSAGTAKSVNGSPFLQWGVVGTVAMSVLLIQSPSVLRHAFYETFLHGHQLLAGLTILAVYLHVDVGSLPQKPYVNTIVFIWILERCIRWFRLAYLNFSRRQPKTHVVVEALPSEACRVTFHLPRHTTVPAGSHVYAYIPSVSWWMSHPFSVAWTNTDSDLPTGDRPHTPGTPSSLEKQPLPFSKTSTSISLVVAARTGMTRQLLDRASNTPDGILHTSGYLEGPYSGNGSFDSYGTVLLFAGGVGITHHLIQIRHLLACAQAETVATRKIVLCWSVRSVEQLEWVRPWMDEVLSMEKRREILKVVLFVTKPRSPREIISPSTTVQMLPGRCKPDVIIRDELPTRIGAVAVSVCGPGAFADEVRQAVRRHIHLGFIDFIEEAFTW